MSACPGQAPSPNTKPTSSSYIPSVALSSKEQFRHVISQFILLTMSTESQPPPPTKVPGLKKIAPYWYPYTTYAKERWLNRELLEVVSTEFRDRSMEYYVRAYFDSAIK